MIAVVMAVIGLYGLIAYVVRINHGTAHVKHLGEARARFAADTLTGVDSGLTAPACSRLRHG